MSDRLRFAILLSGIGDVADYYLTLTSLGEQVSAEWHLYFPRDLMESVCTESYLALLGLVGKVSPLTSYDEISAFDWVLPLLPGDELTPDALAQFASAISMQPQCDLVYCDHAESYGGEKEVLPFFKPGWSPEFLIATDYISRAAVKLEIFSRQVQTVNFDAVDLWSMHLSFARAPQSRVERIERILISIAVQRVEYLPSAAQRAHSVLSNHLRHLGVEGMPRWADWAQRQSILSFEIDFPDSGPSITVVIPSRNNWKMLKRCMDSLSSTTYTNFQVLVVDNLSNDSETLEYLKTISANVNTIASPPSGFSYSYINNEAVKSLNSDYVLFLNDDTEVISPRWLSQMAGWLQIDGVASVGARLLFPNDRIQHAGIVHKMLADVLPGLPYRWLHKDILGPRGQDRTPRNYSALTAACLLISREEFISVGGFDDEHFSIAYNDCDLGFRLTSQGRRNVYEPTAQLYHHEGVSRGSGRNNDKVSEEIAFINKYREWIDPYFNANLSRSGRGLETVSTRLPDVVGIEQKMSIALFTHNLNYEGAPLVLLEIAEGLKKSCGADITVFSSQEGLLRKRYEAADCRVEIIHSWPLYTSATTAEFDRRLIEIIDRLALSGADLVIANTILLHWGMIAAQRLGLPSIWLIHESEPPFEHLAVHGALHVELATNAMRQASASVFVSEATKELYQSYDKQYPAEVIYNGFDFARAEAAMLEYDRAAERARMNIAPDEIVVLLPGTVCERKAQIDLVSAVNELADDVLARTKFLIVGATDNAYTEKLYDSVRALPKARSERLSIIRSTPEILKYFICADILAFPSHLESFPRVIQEAMFFGLGIITTPVFGISEQISEGRTGLFFQPGDVSTLARHLEKLIREPERRIELGKQAQLSLHRFPTITEMQQKYWELAKRVFQTESGNGNPVSENWVYDTSTGRAVWWEELIRGAYSN